MSEENNTIKDDKLQSEFIVEKDDNKVVNINKNDETISNSVRNTDGPDITNENKKEPVQNNSQQYVNQFGPGPNINRQYGPRQEQYGNQFGPGPNINRQYGPRQEQYGNQFGPGPNINRQYGPNQYGPRQEQYGPRQEQYGPRPEQYGPRPEQYGPRPEQYRPRPEQYGPRPDMNGQYGPGQYGPRPNMNEQYSNSNTHSKNYIELIISAIAQIVFTMCTCCGWSIFTIGFGIATIILAILGDSEVMHGDRQKGESLINAALIVNIIGWVITALVGIAAITYGILYAIDEANGFR